METGRNNPLTSLEHLQMSAQRIKSYTDNLAAEVAQTVAGALTEMEENKLDKPVVREISILASGWSPLTEEAGERDPLTEDVVSEEGTSEVIEDGVSDGADTAELGDWENAPDEVGEITTEEDETVEVTTVHEVADAGPSLGPNCSYCYSLAVDGLTSRDRVTLTVSPSSVETAISCGLIPVCLSQEGYLMLGAERQPLADMNAEIWIEKGM